jgi:hypothetical protein
MVSSKNCNDHRNHSGDLVEVEFNAVQFDQLVRSCQQIK